MLPDFLIIGAQKAGTTSLYEFAVRHPAIAPAYKKEINYFQRSYQQGEPWYRSNFPVKAPRYFFTKKSNPRLLTGEASIHYFFYSLVPRRAKETLPDVKLIVMLRNPVDRAYSHYHMALRIYKETLSFEKALELEATRCAEYQKESVKIGGDICWTNYHMFSYLARGVYADQLENWFNHFDKEQFLILTTEDFHDNPQRTLDQVFDFLQVPPFQMENINNVNVGNYQAMNEDTRKFLVKYYRPHNERLAKLLQRDFDWDR